LIAVTAVLSGAVPAWQVARMNLADALRFGATNLHRKGSVGARRTMVAAQVGFAVILVGSGTAILTDLVRTARASWGFDPEHCLLVEVTVPAAISRSFPEQQRFAEAVLDRLSMLEDV
jgi:hypothetical protein